MLKKKKLKLLSLGSGRSSQHNLVFRGSQGFSPWCRETSYGPLMSSAASHWSGQRCDLKLAYARDFSSLFTYTKTLFLSVWWVDVFVCVNGGGKSGACAGSKSHCWTWGKVKPRPVRTSLFSSSRSPPLVPARPGTTSRREAHYRPTRKPSLNKKVLEAPRKETGPNPVRSYSSRTPVGLYFSEESWRQ